MTTEFLYGKSLSALQDVCASLNMPAYTARQICQWLYGKQVSSIDDMTNLSAKVRQTLKDKYDLGLLPNTHIQVSADTTKKYLFPTHGGHFIESAYIPEKERATLCVSTQVGCRMGCKFCLTGKQGFQANLTTNEILNQIRSLPEKDGLTNIVYMGMGEPLDNIDKVLQSLDILTSDWGYGWSPKRITVSTIGIIPAMKEFLEKSKCHLAVSLHTPFDEERKKIMPVQLKYPITDVIKEIRKYDLGLQRRVSFEYILFKHFNDTPTHVKELVRLLGGMRCRVNLIRFHSFPGSELEGVNDKKMIEFRDVLDSRGIIATIRASRGKDIFAACGLLSTRELEKK
jgi:23S rRNA (adenine2503-C2)-methyltransferase